jgi:exopolysaccharide biosynthesis WecB/TagA/CpsF family protein
MTLTHRLHDFDLPEFAHVASHYGQEKFGYVVTPNVDHLIRYHEDSHFRELYSHADYILLDSRVLAYLLRLTKGLKLKVCPGSDLTAHLLTKIVRPDDEIVLIGCSETQVAQLRAKLNLRNLHHFNPPMGFIKSPEAVEEALKFVEAHAPFRFCLIAVGSPQQEIFAQKLRERGIARGLGLCIGASINFLTGAETRAPAWMQKVGMEWAYRLLQDPKRLAKRYLVRGPRVFGLLRQMEFQLQPVSRAVVEHSSLIAPAAEDAAS